MAGSTLGNILGAEKSDKQKELDQDDEKKEELDEDGNVDYKDQSTFAKHMSEKTEALSEFAKKKTIKQQREYLPIFSVREELLQVAVRK